MLVAMGRSSKLSASAWWLWVRTAKNGLKTPCPLCNRSDISSAPTMPVGLVQWLRSASLPPTWPPSPQRHGIPPTVTVGPIPATSSTSAHRGCPAYWEPDGVLQTALPNPLPSICLKTPFPLLPVRPTVPGGGYAPGNGVLVDENHWHNARRRRCVTETSVMWLLGMLLIQACEFGKEAKERELPSHDSWTQVLNLANKLVSSATM